MAMNLLTVFIGGDATSSVNIELQQISAWHTTQIGSELRLLSPKPVRNRASGQS